MRHPPSAPDHVYRIPGSLLYYADVAVPGGRRQRICLDTRNYGVALERLAAHTGPAPHPAVVSPRDDGGEEAPLGTVSWALTEHLHRKQHDLAEATKGIYASQAGHLVRLLGELPLQQLRRADVDGYIEQRAQEGVQHETRRKELMLLRAALRTVARLGAAAAEPLEVLLPQLRAAYVPCDRWLEEEEYRRVLQELRPARRLQVVTACFTGARRAELQRLRWEDIDWKRGVVRVRQSKPRNTVRYVPLADELRAHLEPLKKASGPLLASFENFYRDVLQACTAAKVARFTLNDCRRTFGSWMVQKDVPVFTVSKLMGHSSPNMVQRVYGKLSDESLRRAVDKLPKPRSARRAGRAAGATGKQRGSA